MTRDEVQLNITVWDKRRVLQQRLIESKLRLLHKPVIIYSLLGFYKPTNKSPKPAARLRHSLTILAAQRLESDTFKFTTLELNKIAAAAARAL